LLVIGLSIATLINGSGKYSIDNIIFEGKRANLTNWLAA